MPKIQIITGSTRPGRVNKQVAEWVYDIASQREDLDVELVDIADFNLPLFDEPISPAMGQPAVNEHTINWQAKVDEADGYIFVTPEYNHSVSGALKNAIDFAYPQWNNKAAGFVSYGSASGVRAVEHLRGIMGEIQIADVRQGVMFDLAGDFENYSTHNPKDQHVQQANTMLDQLTAWATALQTVRKGDVVAA